MTFCMHANVRLHAVLCVQSHVFLRKRSQTCAKITNVLEFLMLLYILNAVYSDTETTHGNCKEVLKEKGVYET